MTLAELRRFRGVTQVELAERLGWSQSSVSRFEHQRDMRVSTLAAYVSALGGVLALWAEFDDDVRVRIQLGRVTPG